MKKCLGIFINTILVLGLFLIMQTNKTFAAGSFDTEKQLNFGNVVTQETTLLSTRNISGKISLPNEEVAPTGGLYVNIEPMKRINQYYYANERYETVYIEEGQNSAQYNLQVSFNENEAEYKIRYRIWDSKIKYVQFGYYGLNETIVDKNSAAIIKVLDSDVPNINMVIIKGVLISGKISLPDGKVSASNGLNINVFVRTKEYTLNFATNAYLREGENEANYSVAVPIQNGSMNYIVGYNYYDSGNGMYVSNGYYNSIKTTTNEEKATLVEVLNSNIENINMKLIAGKLIKGTINIPDNVDLPYGSAELMIVARDEVKDVKVQTSLYSENRPKSIDYNLVVPSDSTFNYKVHYELPEYYGGNSLRRGYYSNNGTVANEKDASLISISGEEITSIDMTVLRLQDIPDDYGDNIQEATMIENNSINDGIINKFGDKDYFKFQITQKSLINVYTTGNLDTIGELLDSNGEIIIGSEDGGTYNNFSMMKMLEVGTYYIGVSGNELGVYNLNVQTETYSSENQYKISVEDKGQTPTIEAIYFEGQRASFEFDFTRVLSRGISKVENEYVMELMGFDWSKADKYYVWINDGTSLLKQILTSADKGKTIMLRRDDTYTKTEIEIENAGQNLQLQNFSLHQTWNNGQTMFICNINSDMYLPMGEYGIQINATDETYGYSLLKDKINISKENNLISFKEDELAKLSINMKDYTDSELKFSFFCAAYFNLTYGFSCPPNMSSVYVNKANYHGVWANFSSKDNWEYQYGISDTNITEDKILNFDSQLSCKINLDNSHFSPGEGRYMDGQLQIIDNFDNSLSYIINGNDQGYSSINGKIKIENSKERYEFTEVDLNNPYIVLPDTNGTFYMTFYMEDGPIKIKPTTTIITIGDPNGGTIINYDLNFDGTVDINDIEALGETYGTENGDSGYDVNKDLNGDGVIDIFDLVILSKKIK